MGQLSGANEECPIPHRHRQDLAQDQELGCIEEISRQGPSLDKDQCGPRQIAHAFRPFYMGPAGDFFSTGLSYKLYGVYALK